MNDYGIVADGYALWLTELKQRILTAQQRSVLSVNRELVLLYWHIGRDILDRQKAQSWGAKVIEQLAKDLTAAFTEMKGFSRRNLLYMRSFADEWPDHEFVQLAVAQLPWAQNHLLLTTLKSREERECYLPTIKQIEAELAEDVGVVDEESKS